MLKDITTPAQIRDMNIKQLQELAAEIRRKLVQTVAHNGGHLASNLGVVELTLALHSVFSCPEDKLVFDVGHQAYVHKLLTGRAQSFDTLRQAGGLSGFPRIDESEYDTFNVGHASTAISAALGMARARDLKGEKHAVVAILGDGALSGGMCYEALNDAGQSKTPLIVILNDNEMSISPNVGAMSGYLTELRQSNPYRWTKRTIRSGLDKLPLLGQPIMEFLEKTRNWMRNLVVDGQFFEALGFEYQGPIDGHDMKRLKRVFRRAYASDRPVLVHVITQKGKGYEPAEHAPDEFHGIAPFYVDSGRRINKDTPSNGQIACGLLCELAERDDRIVTVCAAMANGTGMTDFMLNYPKRFFDVGIAEEHAVTMAAGLAVSGFKPYVAIYSTFMQRAYDQILSDVCLMNLPVTLLLDRAGLVGADGATHQGVYDLSFLSSMPNMTIAAPRDMSDLMRLIQFSQSHDGPMAIRYPKDSCYMGPNMRRAEPLKLGEWELLHEGKDAIILATGCMVEVALNTAIELSGRQFECGVVDARFIKPLDEEMLQSLLGKTKLLVTLEQNSVQGGLGSMVMQRLSDWGEDFPVMAIGVPDRFIEQGTITQQLEDCEMTAEQLTTRILRRAGKGNAHGA
ncbi:1-deoxy-D-xylulose-5-phosphate synthase [Eubacteriales bacterium OttesenSCG-928-N13]|nr:1-deoxy-D-xylulose-5-phosphate synthase [Eubacteriales bacterium OttesenSCG-928-N13]